MGEPATHGFPDLAVANEGATPFKWVKRADEILAKAVRKMQADSGARH